MTSPVDARGVRIEPGDTAIYGFGVGRSVAMAEAVVLGEESVSLTPSGRVRLRIVRRSYSRGQKPVVDVAPDRMVVLKEVDGPLQPGAPDPCFALPPSPLPTQDDEVRANLMELIECCEQALLADKPPDWLPRKPGDTDGKQALAAHQALAAEELIAARRKLKTLDEST